jgi:hypothetical protein
MHKLLRSLATAAALVAFSAPTIAAQKESALDDKDVRSYRLSMAGMQKFEKVIDALDAWAKTDPEIQANIKLQSAIDSLRKKEELTEAEQARLEKLEEQRAKLEDKDDDDDMDGDPSVDEIAAEISNIPAASSALRSAGLSAREYVIMALALFEAQAFASFKQQGITASIPAEANHANIKFVQDHAAVLKRMSEKLEKVNKAYELTGGKKGS